MLKIAICDDDIQFCKTLRQMIQYEMQARDMVSETEVFLTGEEMCRAFAARHFDLIFLDIELAGINGVSVGHILRQTAQDMQLVYVSAKEEYAMQLFQNRPFDFLVKPITAQRLHALFDEYFRVFPPEEQYYSFTADRRRQQIAVNSILYFESLRKQIRIVTASQEILVYAKISDILAEPFSSRFLRIHQSFLVNIQHITEFRYGEITLSGGIVLPISRSYQNTVRDFLMQKEQERIFREAGL